MGKSGGALHSCTNIQLLSIFGSNLQSRCYISKIKSFTVCSILINTITIKHITKAQMCASCQKMGHLDKTHTTLKWDIRQCAAQIHKYSVIAYIWVKLTMQMLSKMKILTVWSILISTITFKHITEAQMCASCRNMGHLDKTHTALRWDIWWRSPQMQKYSVLATFGSNSRCRR